MRRSVFLFLSAVLLSLLAVPAINIIAAPNRDAIKWRQKAFLYNMDFASRWASRLLYPFGISTDPKQVIIGRDNWLYLGDHYEQTRTVDRRPPTEADFTIGKKIGTAMEAWEVDPSSKGVKLFKIMIGPNKGVIYQEHLPFWAKPASPNATDALLAGTSVRNYVDLREALLLAKSSHPEACTTKQIHIGIFLAPVLLFVLLLNVSARMLQRLNGCRMQHMKLADLNPALEEI